jgi:hypothetical protein
MFRNVGHPAKLKTRLKARPDTNCFFGVDFRPEVLAGIALNYEFACESAGVADAFEAH